VREGHPPLIRKPERDQSRELVAARPKIGQVGKLNEPWVTVDPSRAHPSILPFAKVILHDRTEAFLSQAATTWGVAVAVPPCFQPAEKSTFAFDGVLL
jgi:hypothetical protein